MWETKQLLVSSVLDVNLGLDDMNKVQGSFIRHILNYTGYNQEWNVKTQ